MMRALIDTNIVMDILFQREQFVENASAIWLANEQGRFEGYISALTPVTVFYIARKVVGIKKARQLVAEILSVFHICPMTELDLQSALTMPIKDYEDAVQAAAALSARLDVIVTRNAADYRGAPVPVQEPSEFLTHL